MFFIWCMKLVYFFFFFSVMVAWSGMLHVLLEVTYTAGTGYQYM